MKKLNLLFIITALLSVGCNDNFDEWDDTSQRYITFTFDSVHLATSVLSYTNGEFQLQNKFNLDTDYLYRVVCYCYDSEGNLIDSQTKLSPQIEDTKITIKHLYKDEKYKFLFTADVVKYDQFVNYYETWFQLKTKSIDDFYIFSLNRSDTPQLNVLYSATVETSPANQIQSIELKQISHNGYCVFTNFGKVNKLSGWTNYYESYYIKDFKGINRSYNSYEYFINEEKSIVLPLTLSLPDDTLKIQMHRYINLKNDTVTYNVYNFEHRPFVLKIDCSAQKLVEYIHY